MSTRFISLIVTGDSGATRRPTQGMVCSHMDREKEVFRTVRNVVSRALESMNRKGLCRIHQSIDPDRLWMPFSPFVLLPTLVAP